MTKKEQFYLIAILAHVGMGFLFFYFPMIGYIYGVAALGAGIIYIVNTANKNNEVLLMAAYFTGMDVYLKMIGATILNEYGKYAVIIFMLLGIFYKGFSKASFLYVFFIALLIPAIFIGTEALHLEANIRKSIAFNISGPMCLGISAIYTFRRRITLERMLDVLTMLILPLVAMLVNLFLYTPSIKEVVINTSSNFATSGGFGPNQVATVLGLGMFIAFTQLLLASRSNTLKVVNSSLVALFAFRCIVTFSRGGMLTGLVMMAVLLLILYRITNRRAKGRIMVVAGATLLAGLLIWGYSSVQTMGLIDKRYANEDLNGRKKDSNLSGREILIESEFEMFLDHPFLGVGVGRNKEVRAEESGVTAASHNEITRLLAEHGSLGIVAFLILLTTPLILYLGNKYQIFALLFTIFWLLTINHAAMRIAAPAFVYSLALLKVRFGPE